MRLCQGQIPTSGMALKWLHKTDELVTNDMKLVQNHDSDEEKHKYNSKILTATLPPLQYTKRPLLKFRRETYVTPSPTTPKMASYTLGFLIVNNQV